MFRRKTRYDELHRTFTAMSLSLTWRVWLAPSHGLVNTPIHVGTDRPCMVLWNICNYLSWLKCFEHCIVLYHKPQACYHHNAFKLLSPDTSTATCNTRMYMYKAYNIIHVHWKALSVKFCLKLEFWFVTVMHSSWILEIVNSLIVFQV